MPNAREIECAVLGNDTPEASVPGEIMPSARVLRLRGQVPRRTPACSSRRRSRPSRPAEVRRLAVEAFRAVDGAGLGRVDFLLDRRRPATWYVNEINTIPGFTTISMYPKLWEASGLAYAALLDRLIDAGLERHAAKQRPAHERDMTQGAARRRPRAGVRVRAGGVAGAPAADRAAPVRGLTHAPLLARAFDLGLRRRLRRRRGRAEAGLRAGAGQACAVIGAAVRVVAHLPRHRRPVARTGRSGRARRTRSSPTASVGRARARRAEAWFYLARRTACASSSTASGSSSSPPPATASGSRTRSSGRWPWTRPHDANFGIGLYRYYADVAPAVLKVLRWFLGLPGGDRARASRRCCGRATRGVLLQAEAAYQLHLVDLWYEHNNGEALELLDELRARHPHNPLFLLNTAQVHEIYRSDPSGALAAYEALVDGARAAARCASPCSRRRGGGSARRRSIAALAEPDRAIDDLRAVVARRPRSRTARWRRRSSISAARSTGSAPRDEAVAAYRAAMAAAPRGRSAPGAPRGAPGPVASARSQDGRGQPAVDRRLARVRARRRGRRDRRARPRGPAAAGRRRAPVPARPRPRARPATARARAPTSSARCRCARCRRAPFVAGSYYELGAMFEASSDRARAIAMYTAASRAHGAPAETCARAERALARLR